jgi:glycosyltransferase involved in cell wall biosynthesis
MLSVIIPTFESERALLATLAVLVTGAVDGIVREVIIADGGSRDATAEIADVAGCRMMVSTAALGARLHEAATSARGPWLLFLQPGTAFEGSWIVEVRRFVEAAERSGRAELSAGVFRRTADAGAPRPILLAAAGLIRAALGRREPRQGLLIAKRFYAALGGHRADVSDPETHLLRRLGRKRTIMLRCAAITVEG